MMSREEARRARPPIAWDSLEGWLRRYALAHSRLLLARERDDTDAASAAVRSCEAWLVRLAERLSPARFAFEVEAARRYGEEEAAQGRAMLRRLAQSRPA